MWNPFNRNTISNSSASKRSLQLITQKGMPFAYVEAYKALRTNLNFLSGSGDVHAFVVTSTVPEEAKSNVSVNLALALTESGKKVVLVDCDLRKPVLHRYLKAGHNLKGVSNVLSRQVALSDALVELKDISNLTFLPAGTTPPNPPSQRHDSYRPRGRFLGKRNHVSFSKQFHSRHPGRKSPANRDRRNRRLS